MTTVVPIRVPGNDIVVARDRNVDLIACGPGKRSSRRRSS